MSLLDFEECDCSCHTDKHMMHIMACCHVCSYCKKNIRRFAIESHEKKCKEKFQELFTVKSEKLNKILKEVYDKVLKDIGDKYGL